MYEKCFQSAIIRLHSSENYRKDLPAFILQINAIIIEYCIFINVLDCLKAVKIVSISQDYIF